MKRAVLFFLCFFPLLLVGQPRTSSKKALKLFNEARDYFRQQENDKALMKLSVAMREDPGFVDVYLLQSDIYREMDSLRLQISSLEKVMELGVDGFPQAGYVLADAYFRAGEYEKARQTCLDFLHRYGESAFARKAKELLTQSEFAVTLIDNPRPFDPENMGDAINSEFDEYWPSLTLDGETFIFTRLLPADNGGAGQLARLQEDFYESKQIDGRWQPAHPIHTLNTPGNEGAQSVSANGGIIFFTACNQPDGFGRCDIYFTRRVGENWTKPRNAGSPVNSAAWESQPSFTGNGEYLYFVSSREGGHGGMDLWRCRLKGFDNHGQPLWGESENLGENVNTPGDENSPFIHPDGVTLYFASNKWPGLGGFDLFYTRNSIDSGWHKPVNLGYPINTNKDERGMIVDASGTTAYFSSDRPDSKGLDIFRFELYEEAVPTPVSYVRGQVVDHRTQLPLCATVELIDLAQGSLVAAMNSCLDGGDFLVSLPLGKEYAMNVSSPGYLFHSENFSLKELRKAYDPVFLTIPLMPVETGSVAALRNVFFETGSFALLEQSKAELERLIAFLDQNPAITVEIGGHTDNVGGVAYNYELSEMRAKSVWQYLVEAGIPENRLSYRGYGMSQPVEPNDTEEGRSRNRRTEFKILKVGEE
ncbi:OmpA family protein [Gaoshiqia sediminis]|uniref:OmpA family protein n=1 Tax=Gaoshiqia sediminis TaxID=2986998 RepID=A0AA41Y2D8_9BACT|nr:OmpA family protein [Gaoshiqia sediminis]MCW0482196.1 OmpA family protein [Gaoshiqia sediminis]